MLYRKKLWMKNFFIITFYVKKFVEKLKKNQNRTKKLKNYHFKLLKDLSNYCKYEDFKELRDIEYAKIIQGSHTNQFQIKLKKFKFCKYLYFFSN